MPPKADSTLDDAARALPWTGSLRVRIGVAFLAALGTMGALLVSLIAWQRPVGEALHLVTDGYLPLSKQIALIRQDHTRLKRDLARLNRARLRWDVEGDEVEIYTEELADNIEIARVIAAHQRGEARRAEDLNALAKVAAYLDGVDSLFQRYSAESAELERKENLSVEQLDEERRRLRATENLLDAELTEIEDTIDHRISELARASEQLQGRARAAATGLLLGSSVFIAGLLGAVLLSLRGISRLTAEAARMAAGDYSRRVEEDRQDEVGRLAAEFNTMARTIELRDRRLSERAAELQRVSAWLTSVVDALDGALLVTVDRRVELANPAARRVWGAVMEWPVPEALLTVVEPGLHELSDADGRRYSAHSVAFGPSGAITILTDVTEQVRAQERLARSERLAIIGQMLAQITHEIRNPLNALSLNVEMLVDEVAVLPGSEEARSLLDMVGREVERLTALSGHYLALARRPEPHPEASLLGPIIGETLRLVEPELRASKVGVIVGAPSSVRAWVDPDQLRQALLNVLRNALQAQASRVQVEVEEHLGSLVISVRDDGCGMDADAVRQATEPFFSTKATGTGLGLAITRQILEDHGGRIEVESELTVGTTVRLHLRREAPQAMGGQEVSDPT